MRGFYVSEELLWHPLYTREGAAGPTRSFIRPGGYDEGGIPDPYYQVGDAADETSKLYFALYVLTFFVLPCG